MKQYWVQLERETPVERKRRIAHHEAGHATAALRLTRGYIQSAVTGVEPNQDKNVSAVVVSFADNLLTARDLDALELAYAAVSRAGEAGELAFCGFCDAQASSIDKLWLYCAIRGVAEESHHRKTGVRSPEAGPSALDQRLRRRLDEGEQLAGEIIRQERTLFHAIADNLLTKRHLSREELLALYEQLAIGP